MTAIETNADDRKESIGHRVTARVTRTPTGTEHTYTFAGDEYATADAVLTAMEAGR